MKRFLASLTVTVGVILGVLANPAAATAIPVGADQATVGVFYAYDYGPDGTTFGGLPPGLTANADGSVTGTPTTAGDYDVSVTYPEVCNPDGTQCAQGGEAFSLTVAPAPTGRATADLRIEPIVLPPSVERGSTIGVGVAAENFGPSPTTPTYLVLTVPAGFTYVGTDVVGNPAAAVTKYGPFVVVSVPRLEAAVPGQVTASRISAVVELTVSGPPRTTAFVAATGSAVRDRALANNLTARLLRVS